MVTIHSRLNFVLLLLMNPKTVIGNLLFMVFLMHSCVFSLILVICGFDWICIVQMMFFMFIFFCGFRSENVKEESELWFVVYSAAAANDWGIISLPNG